MSNEMPVKEVLQQFRAVAQQYTKPAAVSNMSRIAENVVKINREGYTISTIAEGSSDNTNSSSGVSSMTSTRGFPSVAGARNSFASGPPGNSWNNLPTVQPFQSFEAETGQFNDAFVAEYPEDTPPNNRPFPSSGW